MGLGRKFSMPGWNKTLTDIGSNVWMPVLIRQDRELKVLKTVAGCRLNKDKHFLEGHLTRGRLFTSVSYSVPLPLLSSVLPTSLLASVRLPLPLLASVPLPHLSSFSSVPLPLLSSFCASSSPSPSFSSVPLPLPLLASVPLPLPLLASASPSFCAPFCASSSPSFCASSSPSTPLLASVLFLSLSSLSPSPSFCASSLPLLLLCLLCLSASPLPLPLLASVPLPLPLLASVPLPLPLLASVPLPLPLLASVPLPLPLLASVPLLSSSPSSVPLSSPLLASVPLPHPLLASVPLPHPLLASVPLPLPLPLLASVPLPLPLLASVPLDFPLLPSLAWHPFPCYFSSSLLLFSYSILSPLSPNPRTPSLRVFRRTDVVYLRKPLPEASPRTPPWGISLLGASPRTPFPGVFPYRGQAPDPFPEGISAYRRSYTFLSPYRRQAPGPHSLPPDPFPGGIPYRSKPLPPSLEYYHLRKPPTPVPDRRPRIYLQDPYPGHILYAPGPPSLRVFRRTDVVYLPKPLPEASPRTHSLGESPRTPFPGEFPYRGQSPGLPSLRVFRRTDVVYPPNPLPGASPRTPSLVIFYISPRNPLPWGISLPGASPRTPFPGVFPRAKGISPYVVYLPKPLTGSKPRTPFPAGYFPYRGQAPRPPSLRYFAAVQHSYTIPKPLLSQSLPFRGISLSWQSPGLSRVRARFARTDYVYFLNSNRGEAPDPFSLGYSLIFIILIPPEGIPLH
ncbi:hypothetical protein C7M84_020474 [Penaeus vannamei]|uniref:Uncharacterized protein n=1 Tax=Penaeus vannamei TaxID=6689 RepID=A0A423SC11_PENVA|nr:hypothetical protein C7M84_020474 [Penaeus vannamei]